MAFENPSQQEIFTILKQARKIAVVGLSDKPERTSYQVAQVLQAHGYQIIPVNPLKKGTTILGESVYGSLTEIPEAVDIVDVFRRSEYLPEVATETFANKSTGFLGAARIEK